MTILSIKAEKINTKVVKTTSNNYIHFLIPSSFIKAVRTEKVDVSSFNLLGLSKDVRIESSLDVNLYNKASDLLTVTTTKEGVNKKGEEIGEIKLSLNSIIYIVETNNGVEVCVLLPNGSKASIVSYIISETIEELITQIESDLIGDGVSSVNGITGVVVLSTSDIADSTNKRYVTDANLTVIGNTSGINTGDNAVNSLYSGLATSKQDALISGTNIKTINGTTILGSGDIVISASASLSGLTAATAAATLANGANKIEWQWTGLAANEKGFSITGSDIVVNGVTIGLGRYQNLYNVALGLNALAASTNGLYNTAIGSNALNKLTTGLANTAIGENALSALTTGLDNIGIGRQALVATVSGAENIGIGNFSLTSMGTAFGNVAIGKNALYNLNTGNFNVGIGNGSLVGVKGSNNVGLGYQAGYNLTTGTNNTIVGHYTGLGITTGSKNTIIGANISGLATSLSNTIILADGDGVIRYYCNSDGSTGIGTSTPNASAKLDVSSTTQGVLLPRMTTTQKNAIASPAEGLEVYDSTLKKKCFYNGTAWETITSI